MSPQESIKEEEEMPKGKSFNEMFMIKKLNESESSTSQISPKDQKNEVWNKLANYKAGYNYPKSCHYSSNAVINYG